MTRTEIRFEVFKLMLEYGFKDIEPLYSNSYWFYAHKAVEIGDKLYAEKKHGFF